MRSYRKELWFHARTQRALINITPQVVACLKESGIRDGLVLIRLYISSLPTITIYNLR
jgi:thiamine phosphate synthase YjbQ (UPF0047 family)